MATRRRHHSRHGGNRQSDAAPSKHDSDERPLSLEWLSEERIEESIRVWSKAYGRPISRDEATEILINVRQFAEIVLRAEEAKQRDAQAS